MKTQKLNNYSFDSNKLVCLQDGRKLDCADVVSKTEADFRGLNGVFQRFYFHVIDLLSPHISWAQRQQYNIISELSKKWIANQEAFLQERKKIQEMVDQHFTIVEKNVEHLDEAEVICLGETHHKENHQKNNGELIDALSEPNDTILVEKAVDGKEMADGLRNALNTHEKTGKNNHLKNALVDLYDPYTCDQIKYVKKPLHIDGWDLSPLSKANISYLVGQPVTPIMKTAITVCLVSGIVAIPAYFIKPILGIGAGIISALSIGVIRKLAEISDLALLFGEMPPRNRMLCQQTEKKSKPNQRVYVIAGSGHFTPSVFSKQIGVDYTPVIIACQETLDYLRTKKFAILIQK